MAKQVEVFDQTQNVIYDGCEPTTKIGGQMLSSITGYVINAMGLTTEKEVNAEDSYKNYCSAFDKKIGSCEPYFISVKMHEKSKDKIARDMKNLLPRKVDKFDKLIDSAAERAVAVLDISVNSPEQIIYRQNKNEFIVSEFSVMKIFRSGENLEIVPCLMCIKGKKAAGRILWLTSWEESEASMEYHQKKYVLTKFDIEIIIQKIKQKAQNRKW